MGILDEIPTVEAFRLEVPMKGVPQGRPRFSRFGHAYTPEASRVFERTFRVHLRGLWRRPRLEGPIDFHVKFWFVRPPSVSRKRVYCDVKPDTSNLLKAVEDAMNGIVWRDDAQLIRIHAAKEYGPRDEIEIDLVHYKCENGRRARKQPPLRLSP